MIKTIKDVGKIKIESDIKDGEGKRITNDFLRKLLKEFAKQSTRYMKSVSDTPFAYGERQLHSILAPAISKITPTFLMEQPIEREWSKLNKLDFFDSQGLLDYWCRYRDVDFFIEIKHGYDAYSTNTIKKSTKSDWAYMNKEQLQLIKKEAKAYSKNSKGVILLALHIITIYETCKLGQAPKSQENIVELSWIKDNYYSQLKPKPNWGGLWIPKNSLVENCNDESEINETYYPGVVFISKVSNIIN